MACPVPVLMCSVVALAAPFRGGGDIRQEKFPSSPHGSRLLSFVQEGKFRNVFPKWWTILKMFLHRFPRFLHYIPDVSILMWKKATAVILSWTRLFFVNLVDIRYHSLTMSGNINIV